MHSELSDLEIVELCRFELPYNTRHFEVLMRRYDPWVYGVCQQLLRNDADAEDATQDVFLRVFHGLKRFEGRSAFKTWLYRLISNVCADYYAKQKKTDRSLRSLAEHLLTADPPQETDLRGFSESIIGQAIALLGEEDQEILLQRHVVGLSFEELAETAELKLSAAKMRLYRAEERLKQMYQRVANSGE